MAAEHPSPQAMDHLIAWLLLAATPGIARCLPTIRRELGDPLALWTQPRSVWQALGLGAKACRWLLRPDPTSVASALTWLRGAPDERRLITCSDSAYPQLLLTTADPPLVLLSEGPPTGLGEPMLAMVGSRRASPPGMELAHSFARTLAGAGFTIISGLAHGIDGASHRGALSAGGRTVAVLATGPDRVYPCEHHALSRAIARDGQLLSEFLPGTPALRHHFPQRNRIIAGAAVGTLVVEAAERSGSLITARLANEAGREVFAIPGSVRSPTARGCHLLLRDGAVLVERPEDVVDALPALLGALCPTPKCTAAKISEGSELPDTLPPQSGKVIDNLGHDPATIEQIAARSGLTTEALCSILPALEVQGVACRFADGRYALLSRQE
ncbi:MAG: DNA-processing protein DprA [Pseudomonadota bacterium]